MSGGHFNNCGYVYHRVEEFAEELKDAIIKNERNYSPKTIYILNQILDRIEETHKLMKVVDYLFSDDLSEETFQTVKDK